MNQSFLVFCDWCAYLTGLIGAPLGIIEIFFPAVADKIEKAIDSLEEVFRKKGDRIAKASAYQVSFALGVPAFCYGLYLPLTYYSPVLDFPNHSPFFWFCFVLCLLPAASGVIAYLISGTVHLLNRVTDGKALGTIGLILIVVGVICDTIDKIFDTF